MDWGSDHRDVSAEDSGDAPNDSDSDFALETELQVNAAAEVLRETEGLSPEDWQTLDAHERLDVLQGVENRVAELQGRPSVPLETAELSPGEYGSYDGEKITINGSHLNGDVSVDEMVDTVVHEGRHAYQAYAVANPEVASDPSVVAGWSENLQQYLSAEEYGQELYMSQPVEADAWSYAERVVAAWHETTEDK